MMTYKRRHINTQTRTAVLVASSKTLPLALTILTILPAALGDDAGVLGAALLASESVAGKR